MLLGLRHPSPFRVRGEKSLLEIVACPHRPLMHDRGSTCFLHAHGLDLSVHQIALRVA